ncbi:hypothetical protein BGZ80_003574, partial [Entomortierella chlamydospora]
MTSCSLDKCESFKVNIKRLQKLTKPVTIEDKKVWRHVWDYHRMDEAKYSRNNQSPLARFTRVERVGWKFLCACSRTYTPKSSLLKHVPRCERLEEVFDEVQQRKETYQMEGVLVVETEWRTSNETIEQITTTTSEQDVGEGSSMSYTKNKEAGEDRRVTAISPVDDNDLDKGLSSASSPGSSSTFGKASQHQLWREELGSIARYIDRKQRRRDETLRQELKRRDEYLYNIVEDLTNIAHLEQENKAIKAEME